MGLLLNLDYNYYVSTCPFADVSGNYEWAPASGFSFGFPPYKIFRPERGRDLIKTRTPFQFFHILGRLPDVYQFYFFTSKILVLTDFLYGVYDEVVNLTDGTPVSLGEGRAAFQFEQAPEPRRWPPSARPAPAPGSASCSCVSP